MFFSYFLFEIRTLFGTFRLDEVDADMVDAEVVDSDVVGVDVVLDWVELIFTLRIKYK